MIARLLFLFLVWPSVTGTHEDMPFMEHLDMDNNVSLCWGFSEVQDTITFQLTVKTTGWVGFGFSLNGEMNGADIVIGGVGSNSIYFMDYHSVEQIPVVDKKQDYTLLSLTEQDGQTTMMFRRSIQSCDQDDFQITNSPVKLIYAYGVSDDIGYHFNRRGVKEVNLLNYIPRSSPLDSNYLDFVMENITVPPQNTYYHCKVIKVPWLNGKKHIYRIEPLIQNLDLVHHMLLYSCPSSVNQTSDMTCYTGENGEGCFRVVSAWAVGGEAMELPENTGIPIGGQDHEEFYRLEIHYNNLAQDAGRIDNSGLRLYYTAELRKHDVGILTTGLVTMSNWGYAIPPNASDFHSYGLCSTSYFSNMLTEPVSDLSVFAVGLHTHLAGRKVRVGLFRNREQVDFLGLNENYSFELQQVTNLGNIKTIKPGDDIVVECTYDTINRKDITKLGLATTDEMCLAFLFYYPAISITNCWSHPNMHAYNAMMVETAIPIIEEMLNTKIWDQTSIEMHEATMKKIPQIGFISNDNSSYTYYEGEISNMKASPSRSCKSDPSVTTPLPPSANTGTKRVISLVLTASAEILLLIVWLM
ncbi:hypothetical protein DPEC_G00094020 [Dallia pectoralis]|uniref:Uncharacterized protein n=1 Tax=Dallia pectoralis TaxID=75939 RepID=A0ACC2H200_DALPE|nr:hypothetical protein DPEC_G00094020 [Dallia pectoralis]